MPSLDEGEGKEGKESRVLSHVSPTLAREDSKEEKEDDISTILSDTDSDYDDAEEESKVTLNKPYNKERRATIMSAPVSIPANWSPPVYPKLPDEYKRLKESVQNIFFFQFLTPKDMDIVIQAMKKVIYKADDHIIDQGDMGEEFYVLDTGRCDIFVENVGKVMETEGWSNMQDMNIHMRKRNYFGELSLLYEQPRKATVIAVSDTVVAWALDRVTFKSILQDTAQKQQDLYRSFLEQVPLIKNLTEKERLVLADALEPKLFHHGDEIITEGEDGHEFFIIEKGSVLCTKTNSDGIKRQVCDELVSGDYFGELALLNNAKRRATVTANAEPTICLSLGRQTFKRLLGPLESLLKAREEEYINYEKNHRK